VPGRRGRRWQPGWPNAAHGKVLLLEAGAARDRDFWVQVPIGVAKLLLNGKYLWQFTTEAQPQLAGQTIYWPRGRMLGGSSSVNGMIYVRGDPAEFDHWAELGNQGWDHASLLRYFKRQESVAFGDEAYRGRSGPIQVSSVSAVNPNPLSDAFISACAQAGIPLTDDYNGAAYEGASYLQLSVGRGGVAAPRSLTCTAVRSRACASPPKRWRPGFCSKAAG
jgi:choline dehydrogenase